ncbi:TetR/AcrR family transcriptional regulator [Aminipila luticellarii]|uniref:TetR/AcrR family transcriptional regulator n=1 Tax=Aminipila luticellarii TaxID=2507160 RepID=A0A410PXX2_9FIRM|nr:TetR/AcrR family transcriptional regulator [Aminipila luticellarii]QAT43789.1 TetR/AcrR family transcriptional regulator [Aminipila luticellarii]
MENKQDLRIVKTRSNIKRSFIQLLLEKDLNNITVQDILDKALINRKTFYNHYQDKYDLTEQLIHEFFEECSSFFELRTGHFDSMNSFLRQVDTMYGEMYAQRDFILALWNIHTEGIDFYGGLKSLLQQKYEDFLRSSDTRNLDIGFQSNLFSTFMLSVLKYMLDSNRIYTAHDIWNEFEIFYRTVVKVSIDSEENT